MLHARLREIRKAKGMTLQDVADRTSPPTTAQTIGRLETGVRTLSVDWIDRIALALGVPPQEMLALPEGGDVMISGEAGKNGVVKATDGVFSLRLSLKEPMGVRITHNQGSYLTGDIVICTALVPTHYGDALGKDCLIEDSEGKRYFGKLTRYGDGTAEIACHGAGGAILMGIKPTLIAVAKYQVRGL